MKRTCFNYFDEFINCVRIYIDDRLRQKGFGDVRYAQIRIFLSLNESEKPVSILAEDTGLTQQYSGKVCGELEKAGYIYRRSAFHDARSTICLLSVRGHDVAKLLLEIERELDQKIDTDFFDKHSHHILDEINKID